MISTAMACSIKRRALIVRAQIDGKLVLLPPERVFTEADDKPLQLNAKTVGGSGKWRFKRAGALAPQNIEGHDVSPTTVDFNACGIPAFLGGAEDGPYYLLRNSRSRRASRA
jgi:hypothetical protein